MFFGRGGEGGQHKERQRGWRGVKQTGNIVNRRREDEEEEGQVRTERKRGKSLFKMSKSEMSHTPCPPFVPLGPPLVQHASDSSVGRLGRTQGVLSMVTANKQQGELQGLHPGTDGRTDG